MIKKAPDEKYSAEVSVRIHKEILTIIRKYTDEVHENNMYYYEWATCIGVLAISILSPFASSLGSHNNATSYIDTINKTLLDVVDKQYHS